MDKARSSKIERLFWQNIKGISGGQWGEGFKAGVSAFTNFMKSRGAIIEYRSKKEDNKRQN